MTALAVRRLPMAAPDDLGAFEALLDSGDVDPAGIVSLWCKTRGNGLLNDFTKPWVDLLLRQIIARRTGEDPAQVAERVPVLVSGGSEGAVSPHLVILSRGQAGARGLVALTARRIVPPDVQGGAGHVQATAAMIREALREAGLAPADVGLVLVRAPSPPGRDPAVRAAAALGSALALGEIAAHDEAGAYARRCFVVARHDGPAQQVLVIGNGAGGDPRFAIGHGTLADPLDSPAVAAILDRLGLRAVPQVSPADSARVIAVIAKGDAPADGLIRGLPHAMHQDNDVAMHRHARAAYGAMLGSVVGHGACLVSGGAEGQGPPDGGFASIIVRSTEDAA